MPWLDICFQKMGIPFIPNSVVLDAHAVNLFSHAAGPPKLGDNELIWLKHFLSCMRDIQQRNAQPLWLQAVDKKEFLLDAVDHRISTLRNGLIIDASGLKGTPKVINGRVVWKEFVCDAIVENTWEISHWKNRAPWFTSILCRGWSSGVANPRAYEDYANTIATRHLWARDELLAQRILFINSSRTLDSMFTGPASSSVPFIKALATIALRVRQCSPSPIVLQLHRQTHAAWPSEMQQLEAAMHAQAMFEGTSLEQSAALAKAMELGEKGYSAYFNLFAEGIYALMCPLGKSLDMLDLPALD